MKAFEQETKTQYRLLGKTNGRLHTSNFAASLKNPLKWRVFFPLRNNPMSKKGKQKYQQACDCWGKLDR